MLAYLLFFTNSSSYCKIFRPSQLMDYQQQLQVYNVWLNQRMNVALVSDFYYPFVGGVQIHIKQLATLLSKHQKIANIIVVTHKYDHHNPLEYVGVRNHHGFRVYYLNVHYNKQHMITYPTFVFNFRKTAQILNQQNIDIVHCHQTGSTLALEFIFFATILGKKVMLTQHSLYGFRSFSDIHFNRVCQLFVPFCDQVIAVSKTTRNNIILRTRINANKVVVIPNGVSDVSQIRKKRQERLKIQQNNKTSSQKRIIKIISVGRMTFRRGTDLLIEILPKLCKQHHDIEILIVGDGIKRRALQKTIEIHRLQKQVRLLGIISNHESLLEKMSECDIFLNTPLTESFGIALAEAAMLGLYCVSTNVGGVEEAIPTELLFSSPVDTQQLVKVTSKVINKVKNQKSIKKVNASFEYKWENVCQRTIQIYQHVARQKKMSKKQSFKKAVRTGNLLQILFAFLAVLLRLIYILPFFN